ncbi:KWG Leptospira [compost metagenome]
MAPIKEKNWGFINESGKIVIPTQYGITAGGIFAMFQDQQKGFIDGVARVKNQNAWGFLKPDGTVLCNQWYDNAEPFQK